MPTTNTITSTDLVTASAGLTLTSTKWNNHTSIWRGNLLPVDGSTSAAVNNSYDLGSSTYKWKDAYLAGKLFQTIASTTGAFSFGAQHMVLCNATTAAFSLTLPAAANYTGVTIALKKTDSTFNVVTVDGNGAETIDSTTTTYLSTENECLYLTSDGTNWQKKNRYIDGKWNTFTPTGNFSTNVTFSGKWSRIKNEMRMKIGIRVSGALTTTSKYINHPSGAPALDTGKIPDFTTTAVYVFGHCVFGDQGTSYYPGSVTYYDTTSGYALFPVNANNVHDIFVIANNTVPFTWGAGDFFEMDFKVPITNWED